MMQIERGPDSRGKVEHGTRDSKFGLIKPSGSYSLAKRHVKDIEKVHNRDKFQIRLSAGRWET